MSFLCWSGLEVSFLLLCFHFKCFLKGWEIVCVPAGTSVSTENSALSLAKVGSLQWKSEWVNMSCVLAEGALVLHSNVAVILGSCVPVFLVVGILNVSSRFFMYPSSLGKFKRKKKPNKHLPYKQAKELFFFLSYNFCIFAPQKFNKKSYTAGSLGATGKCRQLQRGNFLWPLLMGPLLLLLSNFLFQNKTSKLLIMCRAWQQENMQALGHSVQFPTVGSGWGE